MGKWGTVPILSAEDLALEEWRVIEEYPDYEVSSLGRTRHRPRQRLLKQWVTRKGYATTCLGFGNAGRRVHQLVLIAFRGQRPPGMFARHLDGNPANNRVDNLAWGTQSENEIDKRAHGKMKRGHKLSLLHVHALLALHAQGVRATHLSKMFGISVCVASQICRGRIWKRVDRSPFDEIKQRLDRVGFRCSYHTIQKSSANPS